MASDGTKQEVSYPVLGLGGASSDGFRVQGGNSDSAISLWGKYDFFQKVFESKLRLVLSLPRLPLGPPLSVTVTGVKVRLLFPPTPGSRFIYSFLLSKWKDEGSRFDG